MDNIEEVQFIKEFFSQNPLIKNRLIKLFGQVSKENEFWRRPDYDLIYAISQNKRIFLNYCRGEFEKYYDISEAIYAAENRILVSFTDIKLYAVVKDIEDFKKFAENTEELIEDGEHCNINQIILSDQKQKIVFVSSDNTDIFADKIRTYIKNYLGADVSIAKTNNGMQITIENYVDNYDSAIIKFTDLQEHIRTRDYELAKVITLIPRMRKLSYKYSQADISESVTKRSLEELIKVFKSLPSGPVGNVPIVIAINSNVNINNRRPSDKYQIAHEWVKNNLPIEHEITTKYYDRYLSQNNTSITIQKFTAIVTEFGYVKKGNGRERYWTRN